MDNTFKKDEKLYRAIYPPEIRDIYWKRDGSVSHLAFYDPRGLSVDRGDYRPDSAVVYDMKRRLQGHILCLYAKNCMDVGAVLKYSPSKSNPYHTEIHGDPENIALSKHQCLSLSRKAKVIA